MLTHGSLFAGIGGFDLGFERAGIKTIWQVEIDAYCRRVLAKNFPTAQRFIDIRECGAHNLLRVDILSGGFPCQDISNAGKRIGIGGERSGLWSEYARIIRELRPRYAVVENVAALLGRGMERVLRDLAACGYDAEWQSIRASDVGAPHRRERIWILAYRACDLWRASGDDRSEPSNGRNPIFPDADFEQPQESHHSESAQRSDASSSDVSHAERGDGERLVDGSTDEEQWQEPREGPLGLFFRRVSGQWEIEPDVGRVAHGIPARVDRLRGLGNAIVPQIAEWIGRQIVNAELSQVDTVRR
jgi:DNA (cytosine-5)-methyltransferase 1